jgi:hypothetical protein
VTSTPWGLATVLILSTFAVAQSAVQQAPVPPSIRWSAPAPLDATEPAPARCSKTITFAIAEGGQPVPAIPKFAAKWFGKTKHVEGYPGLCLSQMPSARSANYVVIFSTTESTFDGLTPTAHTYSSSGPLSGNAAGASSYGGTWNYSYTGTVPPETTSSIALLRIDASKKVLVLRTYDQTGRKISHYNVDGDHGREKLLEQVFVDIHHDIVEKPSLKQIAAPLSVYYVNCDVDSPGRSSLVAASDSPASAAPAPMPAPPPPPQATLDVSSNPVGADIYLDGAYIGKTPLTATVAPGEHVIVMRKLDFSVWGRKLNVVAGPRRVNAYLERKYLTLPPGSQ